MADNRIKATLRGHADWAFRKFQALTGRGDSLALEVIIDRWLRLDSELVNEYGLTAADFQRETAGGEVVPIDERRRGGKAK